MPIPRHLRWRECRRHGASSALPPLPSRRCRVTALRLRHILRPTTISTTKTTTTTTTTAAAVVSGVVVKHRSQLLSSRYDKSTCHMEGCRLKGDDREYCRSHVDEWKTIVPGANKLPRYDRERDVTLDNLDRGLCIIRDKDLNGMGCRNWALSKHVVTVVGLLCLACVEIGGQDYSGNRKLPLLCSSYCPIYS